jgi:hypothetical protein
MAVRTLTRERRERARLRLEVRTEIERLSRLAREGLAEIDGLRQPSMDSNRGVILDGRIEGDKIITD